MKILVGSENPTKLDAVKKVFLDYFGKVEVVGMSASSNVSDQPVGSETLDGAKNRAVALKKINDSQKSNADFFVGIEGGIVEIGN